MFGTWFRSSMLKSVLGAMMNCFFCALRANRLVIE